MGPHEIIEGTEEELIGWRKHFAGVAHRMNMQKEIETFTQRIKRLEEQNKIMKEALEKYADENSWEMRWDSRCVAFDDDEFIDKVRMWSGGRLAREALKKCEEME